MNHDYFESLIVSLVFEKFPKEMQDFLSSIMLTPAETVITGEVMAT